LHTSEIFCVHVCTLTGVYKAVKLFCNDFRLIQQLSFKYQYYVQV